MHGVSAMIVAVKVSLLNLSLCYLAKPIQSHHGVSLSVLGQHVDPKHQTKLGAPHWRMKVFSVTHL